MTLPQSIRSWNEMGGNRREGCSQVHRANRKVRTALVSSLPQWLTDQQSFGSSLTCGRRKAWSWAKSLARSETEPLSKLKGEARSLGSLFRRVLSPIREGISRTLLIHLGPGSFTFNLYSERIKHSPSWRVKECLAPGFPLRILSICDCSRHLENLKSATKRGAESVPTFNAFSKGSVGRTRREGLDAILSCLFLDFTFTNCEMLARFLSFSVWHQVAQDWMPLSSLQMLRLASFPSACSHPSFLLRCTLEKVLSAFDFVWQGFENWASLGSR